MTSFLYRMPAGIAGAISRPQDLTTEPAILSNATPFVRSVTGINGQNVQLTAYGAPGKFDDDGNFVPLAAGDAANDVAGFLVRPYPTTSVRDFQHQVYNGGAQTGDILKRGYMTVNVGEDATEVKRNAPVYFDPEKGQLLIDASDDGGGNDGSGTDDGSDGDSSTQASGGPFAIPTAVFNGPGDADGNIEIAYNI